ncbi:hypothetical protein [Agrobacterium leguminum]|uniref:hypothetical protein n=1 Tax=Agrobacterium leguminum TaxID=2792015 RepID=UPI003CE5B60F
MAAVGNSPEQKGHVERIIKTFQHEVGPQLSGYIGHSVADRKAIEGRKSFAQRLGADDRGGRREEAARQSCFDSQVEHRVDCHRKDHS